MFLFEQPSVFESSSELGDITGLYLVDDEGVMQVPLPPRLTCCGVHSHCALPVASVGLPL